jgi:hypothetical protein
MALSRQGATKADSPLLEEGAGEIDPEIGGPSGVTEIPIGFAAMV